MNAPSATEPFQVWRLKHGAVVHLEADCRVLKAFIRTPEQVTVRIVKDSSSLHRNGPFWAMWVAVDPEPGTVRVRAKQGRWVCSHCLDRLAEAGHISLPLENK